MGWGWTTVRARTHADDDAIPEMARQQVPVEQVWHVVLWRSHYNLEVWNASHTSKAVWTDEAWDWRFCADWNDHRVVKNESVALQNTIAEDVPNWLGNLKYVKYEAYRNFLTNEVKALCQENTALRSRVRSLSQIFIWVCVKSAMIFNEAFPRHCTDIVYICVHLLCFHLLHHTEYQHMIISNL